MSRDVGFGSLLWLGFVLAAVVWAAAPASASLRPDTVAPDFHAPAARGGTVVDFSLKSALARGPVVLYFFPKAFTSGCTVEAHAFSDHIAQFTKAHATVVGISADSIETQQRFSTQACRSKFFVASDPGLTIARSYDAVLLGLYANRTSYVIARDGKIIETYTNLEPLGHIDRALTALHAATPKT